MEKDFLVVIRRFNEAKVVFERSHESVQSLGVGAVSVQDPDGDRALLAGSLHLVDGELHLEDQHSSDAAAPRLDPFQPPAGADLNLSALRQEYLISSLRLTAALQVFDVVRHGELHPTVFIRNHALFSFL